MVTVRSSPPDQIDAPAASPNFRLDIQGLRAVAVIIVILDHLFGWPSGGFVGVDVFFVISGFLITGFMLKEHRQTGQISWSGFYRRRVRRIIPAASLCLAVTVAASYVIYRSARFDSIKTDAIWSFFFASNWHYAEQGTDYLQASGPVSPLQHFWSLSVEEQFYVAWPALLIVVLGYFGRKLRVRGRSVTRLLAAVMAVVIMVSFAWAMIETKESPTWAYFSTFSRFWELTVGALLAVSAARLTGMPGWLRPILSWAGLITIAASLFLINTRSAFPGPWAALPVLGAALVLTAGIGRQPRYGWPLSNPASVYVGKVSYSLYLWHFPVIILLASVIKPAGPTYYSLAIVLMVGLSITSFHFVEDKVRKSHWLELDKRRHSGRGVSLKSAAKATSLAVLSLVVAVLSTMALTPPPAIDLATLTPAKAVTTEPAAEPSAAETEAALSKQIESALSTTQWPELSPSLDNAILGRAEEVEVNKQCLNPPSFDPAMCTSRGSDTSKRAVVVGDSVAIHWLASIRAALQADGYSVHGVALQNCPFASVQILIRDDPGPTEACNSSRPKVFESIRNWNPDLIIASDVDVGLNRLASGARGAEAGKEWQAGVKDSITSLKSDGRRIVVLSPNPSGLSPSECASRMSTPSDCISQISEEYNLKSDAESAAASANGAEYIDSRSWFCTSGGQCPPFIGSSLVRYDTAHLTSQFAKKLVPLLRAKLSRSPTTTPTTASSSASVVDLPTRITQALTATEWPDLDPTIDDAIKSGFPDQDGDGCAPVVQDGRDCDYTGIDPAKLVIVAGDSMAVAWMPGIRAALEPKGWVVKQVTAPGCPFLNDNTLGSDPDRMKMCEPLRDTVVDAINRAHPAKLIVSNRTGYGFEQVAGTDSSEIYDRSLRAMYARVASNVGKLYVLAPPPIGKDPAECATNLSTPADCISQVGDEISRYAGIERSVAEANGGVFVDTQPWFCVSGRCPLFVDSTTVRRDARHVTAKYSLSLAPQIAAAIG